MSDAIIIKPVKTEEPCPCCGQPIKTKDRNLLYLLGWIKATGTAPISLEQLRKMEEANDE